MNKLIAALIAAIFGAMLVPAPAVGDAPTRILIVGDSVTHGSDGDYTWRYFSWRGLMQTGASVDFVGPNVATNGGAGSYADPSFDTDHYARWGLSMWEMLDRAYNPASPHLAEQVEAQDPDVVIEMLGANDFMWFGFTRETMASQVRAFVAEARSVKADVDVVISPVPQEWIREAAAYNALLPSLAASLSTPGSHVVAAPVADFVQGIDTYDNAHPTTAGQVKLAAAVSVALEELGIGRTVTMPLPTTPGAHDPMPEPSPEQVAEPAQAPVPVVEGAPTTPPPEVAPLASPRRVHAKRNGVKVIVEWRGNADRYAVKCGTVKRSTGSEMVTVRARARSCKVRSLGDAQASPWVRVRVL